MRSISAEEFDRRDEAGEDLDEYIDWDRAWRPGIAELARKARAATGLSQAEFAERYQIPLSTFRNWEQGQRVPDEAGKNYLRLIARIPDIVAETLRHAA